MNLLVEIESQDPIFFRREVLIDLLRCKRYIRRTLRKAVFKQNFTRFDIRITDMETGERIIDARATNRGTK